MDMVWVGFLVTLGVIGAVIAVVLAVIGACFFAVLSEAMQEDRQERKRAAKRRLEALVEAIEQRWCKVSRDAYAERDAIVAARQVKQYNDYRNRGRDKQRAQTLALLLVEKYGAGATISYDEIEDGYRVNGNLIARHEVWNLERRLPN